MGKRFTRHNGESMPEFTARIRAIQEAERAAMRPPIRTRKRQTARADNPSADLIDGYSRDDLGESPDY